MRVEFFGVSRQRAGTAALDLDAATFGELVAALAAKFPALRELIVSTDGAGRLHPALAASLNGDRFISDPATPLARQDSVWILSADAGG